MATIAPSEADIERERLKADGEYPDAYLETLAVLRGMAEVAPLHGRLLVHAVALEYRGDGYLFCAPSGTGKSTHARLWCEHLGADARILNGDKCFIEVPVPGAERIRSECSERADDARPAEGDMPVEGSLRADGRSDAQDLVRPEGSMSAEGCPCGEIRAGTEDLLYPEGIAHPEVPRVYGSPWMGKEGWGFPGDAPLKGICMLSRAHGEPPHAERLDAACALSACAACLYMPHAAAPRVASLQLIDALLHTVPVVSARVNIDVESVEVVRQALAACEGSVT
ncbi:MAG: hypothetical protein Q4B77_01420 [Coriobacteriaceae bacterium]|nr:hypothetical protein [Coriobacteriaceae bacterium]